jgi:hypothetical protein
MAYRRKKKPAFQNRMIISAQGIGNAAFERRFFFGLN